MKSLLLLLTAISFTLTGCYLNSSLSGIDGATASASFQAKSESDFIGTSNQNKFRIFGSCDNSNSSIEILIENNSQKYKSECTNGSWSTDLDLTNLAEGNYTFKVSIVRSSSTSTTSESLTVIKDTTPPNVSSLTLNDGIASNDLTQSPSFVWSAAIDDLSGIDHYELAAGTVLGGVDLKSWTAVGNVLTSNLTGLSLLNGSTYYESLRAVDRAGNVSSVKNGDGWLIDLSAPATQLFLRMVCFLFPYCKVP